MKPRERALHMATFAVPLSGNKGSVSMFLGLRDAFAKAGIDAHFSVFSYYPNRDAEIAARMENVSVHPGHPRDLIVLLPMIILNAVVPFLVPKKWKGHINALRQSDVVLMIGGTTFADSMLYKVPWNLLAALPGYWLRRKTMFLSQTIGPAENPLNRIVARWTLRRAVVVQGRGRHSERWARKIGVEKAGYQPDLSFSMKMPEFDEVAKRSAVVAGFCDRLRDSGKLPVGVAPNSIVQAKAAKIGLDYVAFMAGVVSTISAQGYLPVLIPHSYREGTAKAHNNDRTLCASIIDRLDPGVSYYYVDEDLDSGQLRALIGRLHLLVASRFHSMISSLSVGVPPLTYGWGHHKYTEVLEEFDVAELYSPFKDLDVSEFADKLASVSANREELSRKIVSRYANIRAQSESIPRLIVEALGE